LSDDFTRCLGSIKECAEYIPHTGFRYEWIDELYCDYLKGLKEEPNCKNFEMFYMELIELQRGGKLELSGAGRDVRERMARQREKAELNSVMEECFKQMVREGKITKVNWMYRKV